MDGVVKVLQAARKADDIDEDTQMYLLECLRDADTSEWQDIIKDFLPPHFVEKIAALAPPNQLENKEANFEPVPRVTPASEAPPIIPILSRTQTAMSAIPEDAEKSAKAKLSVGSFYTAHPDDSCMLTKDEDSTTNTSGEEGGTSRGRTTTKKRGKALRENSGGSAHSKASGMSKASTTSKASAKSKGSTTSNLSRRTDKPVVTVQQKRQADVITNSLCIDIKGLTISFGGRELLSDADLRLLPGRYGFIGANGAGKSTLLRLMNERIIPGYPDLETLLVEQEDIGDDKNPVEAVMAAHPLLSSLQWEEKVLERGLAEHACTAAHLEISIRRLEAQIAGLETDSQRLVGERGKKASKNLLAAEKEVQQLREDLQQVQKMTSRDEAAEEAASASCTSLLQDVKSKLAELDEEALRAKAAAVLRGLDLKREQLEASTSSLSGGWRMRVALAKALFVEPKVLILDEPTNHLDWGSMFWLEEYLNNLNDIILIVVSHDRQFLDSFCTSILRLVRSTLEVFKGNYTDYEATAAQLHRAEEKAEEKRTSVGQVRRKSNAGKHEFEHTVYLQFDVGPKLTYSGPLFQCRGVVAGYPGKALTKAFDLSLDLSSRVAILGYNGSGKTTVLRTMAKDLAPLKGDVYQHHSLRVGYFAQHQAEALPFDKTPMQVLTAFGEDVRESEAEAIMSSFGFTLRQLRQPIGTMSGGEKCRLALARIVIKQPHILLLDEPTNHLDLLTVVALSDALKAFEGGVVLVSHDRRLIKEVCPETHQQYLLDGGVLKRADGLSKFERSVRVAIKKDAHG